jgi:hypothetical protein
MVSRNWPLVGFAYSAEHGLLGNLKWGFDDDGLCLEGHYQSYTTTPILWMTELLRGRGIDLYDERLYWIVHSKGAVAIGAGFDRHYPAFAAFLDKERFAGKPFLARIAAGKPGGAHLTASTLLKWRDLEVAMNWGTHIMRSAHDRAALTIRGAGLKVGGGSYNHSSFGQSIIIVDEKLQNSVPAEVVSVDVEGPVQHVTATSDKHYPGTIITRTFALLEDGVLVIDRAAATDGRPHTFDWFLKGAGGKLSVETEKREGSWTAKPDDKSAGVKFGGSVASHRYGRTDASWQEGGGRLTMAAAPGTVILATGSDLVVRRPDTRATDYVAFFSRKTKSVERVPVKRADGKPADAVGVKVTLTDGKTFHALVSYEPEGTEVVVGDLRTKERFATDYAP